MTVSILGIIFNACSVKKYIPEDERLYTGAEVTIDSDSIIKNENLLKAELESVLRPEPNGKFLGMYSGLYFYYKNLKEKPGFINRWLYKKFGEEPVYQSDVKPYEVEELLRNRLENRGFFYSQASSSFTENDKTASVDYKVVVPTPYTMATYTLDSLPSPIYQDIHNIVKDSKLREGMRFDLSNLKMERERIDFNLKKQGYYNFNERFLIFEADTNQYRTKRFDLFLKLKKDVPEKGIVPYKLSKISVFPNYNVETDTISGPINRFNDKNYIQENLFFKPKYLDQFITLEEGQYYDSQKSKNTARRLATIGAYKFVNIQYQEKDSLLTDSLGMLEANIYLSPLNKRAIRAELQAVTKSNNFAGPAVALTFSNRNLFKGGETLNISTKFGYESQIGGKKNSGLSSIELGLKGELIFPRMLIPFKIKNEFFKYAIPKTKMSLSADYLSRTKLYTLLSGTGLFGYLWDANKFITHQINPISINYTRLSKTTEEFDQILDDNPFLKRSFEQQFISGLTYAFTYNGMVETNKKHQIYFETTIDVAGNSLSLFSKEENPGDPKTIFGLEYAQYAKADIDIHYHYNFGKQHILATRLFAGYGLPYGNSDVIPFVKQYFSGGPYSVRSFRIRSLGPGTYNGDFNNGNFFDQTGNIRLEANVEYRFPLINYLNGALFMDAGNVWNSKENPSLPGGKFSGDFLSELGMGVGFGMRVDVQGFIIRLDLAAPFHDPGLPKGERFNFDLDAPILNFAIGYPF
ncbi:translocation and assembly module lipoprotein TamL [Changchengzhania lutea]|uniref:translocation and assembly module lipoprotein TamL n=1 Tax=Changchengzhania lutea TaxID=2049305 RepID=UPI00115D0722|nr:BamA/TamA family outer membrane protein [Changchengzhania lutea]